MSIREIPRSQWRSFLEEFSRGHRAWLATLDSCSTESREIGEKREIPLQSVTPLAGATGTASIEIRFLGDSDAGRAVHIDSPVQLRVDETSEGTACGLEIIGPSGECTRVRFRAAPRPEMLDGVAPGELPRDER